VYALHAKTQAVAAASSRNGSCKDYACDVGHY
jgi:hypothetical protein